jgi:predicted RNA-binding Zn ribbon-like protein
MLSFAVLPEIGVNAGGVRPEDLFAPLAHAAAMLFANTNRERMRKCDQCVLHFLDTSKKGTRRWCRHAAVRKPAESRSLCGPSTGCNISRS